MDKPKPGELEDIAMRFSQTGAAARNSPETMMLADIIRRLSALEKSMVEAKEKQHQWGQDTEYKWYQSCKCPRCAATYSRIAQEQEEGIMRPTLSGRPSF